ncbi:MAG TPA: RcpC/CpaB family pilus assembly protein [Streptosporangiaceae bacterium]|jgi:pilus assembly protein CpaB|nr:RcpC/CpaB family pilus assembly protein [Streptosporangiaceae bacterium]
MTRRILTVALALVLAVLGAVGVLSYAHQADQRALAGMRAVTAYVAKGQIPPGTTAGLALREGLLVSQQFPASSVPADAVRSIPAATAGLVLTGGLASGQMLLSQMLGTSVQTAAALPIPSGMVAVTLQFCVQQAVANYITPGSQVAVFNTFVDGQAATGACSGGVSSARSGPLHTRLVLPKVLVLAVGEGTATAPSSTAVAADPASSSTATASSPSTIYLTMAVSQANAERLIELGEAGSPYLALVTSASGTKTDTVFQP